MHEAPGRAEVFADWFCEAVTAAEVTVVDPGWAQAGPHPGFEVRYRSPSEGLIESRPDAALVVEGTVVEVGHDRRFDNPYTSIARGETTVPVRDGQGGWILDLAAGTRGPAVGGGRS